MARNLRADWLNGWLAALGITVLVEEASLSWSDSPTPSAILGGVEDLARAIADALPAEEDLLSLAIARDRPGVMEMPRNFSPAIFAERASLERASGGFSLAVSVTDMSSADLLPHSPFDVSVPRGETLCDRLMACRRAIDGAAGDPAALVTKSLQSGFLTQQNGLGFDIRRLTDAVQPSQKVHTDPVVEMLAFHGMSFFAVWGNGGEVATTRGWTGRALARGSFCWPTWAKPLDRWGIDALLDLPRDSELVTGTYESVPYRPSTSSDVTRGYGSRRLR